MNSQNENNVNKMSGHTNKVVDLFLGKLPMYIGLIMAISIILVMAKNLVSGNLNSDDIYFAVMSIVIMSFVLYLGIVMYIQESKKSKKK